MQKSHRQRFAQLCHGWRGVVCNDEVVTGIGYENMQYGNLYLDCLPPTVRVIRITGCHQEWELKTKRLPRALQIIDLDINRYFGVLDLTVLPERLTTASFVNNRLTGPISLVRLPRTLQVLKVFMNRMEQDFVWYDDLPEGIQTIGLMVRRDSNRMRWVKAVDRKKKVAETKHIFYTGGKMVID